MIKHLLLALALLASPAHAQNVLFPANPGDMIVKGATTWGPVPGGTAGCVLQSNGPTAAPTWQCSLPLNFQLPPMAVNTVWCNVSGAQAPATACTISQILNTIDYDIQRPPLAGSIPYVGTDNTWHLSPPSTAGWVWTTQGPGVIPRWAPMGAPVGNITVGATAITGGTTNNILFNNAGVLGDMSLPAVYASQYITCNGTDQTAGFATLATALGAGGKTLIMPQGMCLTGSWSLAGKENITIIGQGGADILELGVIGTAIVCTQTGSATCFDWNASRGIVVKDISIGYNSSTYSGVLLSLAQASSVWVGSAFENVQFKHFGTTPHQAVALLYLKDAAGVAARNTKFEHAINGIVGAFNGGSAHGATNFSCSSCTFTGMAGPAVVNPGAEWSFSQSWFFAQLGTGIPSGIVSEAANVIESLTIVGTSFTDGTAVGTWIDIGAINGYTHIGGVIGGDAGIGVGIKLGNVAGAKISGVVGAFLATGIQVTGTCGGLKVDGNNFVTTTTPKTGTTGCTNSLFDSNIPTSMNTFGLGITNAFAANQVISLSQDAQTKLTITNPNAGASSSSALVLTSDGGNFFSVTSTSIAAGAQSGHTWTGAGGLLFSSIHATGTIVFDTGGFNERSRFLASGAINFGATAVDLGAVGRVNVEDYLVTTPKTVGGLSTCNAAARGARSMVTDANATFTAGIGAVVAAGGANNVPVTCDGTNWRIG